MAFKYNGKLWNPKNPEKKLKQLGITWNDVEIIETEKNENKIEEVSNDIKKYYFKNKQGETITSIYSNLDNLNGIININEYELCNK